MPDNFYYTTIKYIVYNKLRIMTETWLLFSILYFIMSKVIYNLYERLKNHLFATSPEAFGNKAHRPLILKVLKSLIDYRYNQINCGHQNALTGPGCIETN